MKRVAVVTGGAQGIGAAIVEALALDHDVAVLDLKESRRALWVSCDVGRRDSVEQALSAVEAKLGVPSVLVNNAGIGGPFHRIDEVQDDEWERIVSTNLRSVFWLCRALLPKMGAQGFGRVVNIASVFGLRGGARSSTYAATKHAVIGYTRALADEWGDLGVTCNAICPGYIDTPAVSAEAAAVALAKTPVGRLGRPEEIAALVAHLCGPQSGYINGVAWAVDGGITSSV